MNGFSFSLNSIDAEHFWGLLLIGGLVASGLLGCGSGANLPGETGTVSGTLTYEGRTIPEEFAVIMVHRETGIIGMGVTNSRGEFQIRMRGGRDVLVGDYSVFIKPPGEPDENTNKLTPENVPEDWNCVPAKYWSQDTSGETFTVQPGANQYDFVLTD